MAKAKINWGNKKDESIKKSCLYQLSVPSDLHEAVMKKSKEFGVKLTPWMRMHYERFLALDMQTILNEVQEYNRAKEVRSKKQKEKV